MHAHYSMSRNESSHPSKSPNYFQSHLPRDVLITQIFPLLKQRDLLSLSSTCSELRNVVLQVIRFTWISHSPQRLPPVALRNAVRQIIYHGTGDQDDPVIPLEDLWRYFPAIDHLYLTERVSARAYVYGLEASFHWTWTMSLRSLTMPMPSRPQRIFQALSSTLNLESVMFTTVPPLQTVRKYHSGAESYLSAIADATLPRLLRLCIPFKTFFWFSPRHSVRNSKRDLEGDREWLLAAARIVANGARFRLYWSTDPPLGLFELDAETLINFPKTEILAKGHTFNLWIHCSLPEHLILSLKAAMQRTPVQKLHISIDVEDLDSRREILALLLPLVVLTTGKVLLTRLGRYRDDQVQDMINRIFELLAELSLGTVVKEITFIRGSEIDWNHDELILGAATKNEFLEGKATLTSTTQSANSAPKMLLPKVCRIDVRLLIQTRSQSESCMNYFFCNSEGAEQLAQIRMLSHGMTLELFGWTACTSCWKTSLYSLLEALPTLRYVGGYVKLKQGRKVYRAYGRRTEREIAYFANRMKNCWFNIKVETRGEDNFIDSDTDSD